MFSPGASTRSASSPSPPPYSSVRSEPIEKVRASPYGWREALNGEESRPCHRHKNWCSPVRPFSLCRRSTSAYGRWLTTPIRPWRISQRPCRWILRCRLDSSASPIAPSMGFQNRSIRFPALSVCLGHRPSSTSSQRRRSVRPLPECRFN